MNKKIFKILLFLPIIFSFSFLWKINLSKNYSINFLDIFLLSAIFGGSWFVIKERFFQEFLFFLSKQKIKLLWLGIFILSVLGGIFSLKQENEIINALGYLKSFIILPIFFSILLSFFLSKKIINLNVFWRYFLLTMSFIILSSSFFLFFKKLTFDKRLTFFYDSPNHFAMILSPTLLIVIWMFFYKKDFIKKHFAIMLFFSFLLIVNLYFTKSLGAFLALIIAIFYLFLSKKNQSKIINFFNIFIFLLIFFSSFFIINNSFFLKNYSAPIQPTSFDSRLMIYQSGERILKDNWIKGIGIGNFQEKYLEYQKFFSPYPQWAILHSHNNFLQAGIENGFLGIISLFALIFIKIFKTKKNKSEKILIYSIFIYFSIHGIFDATFWHNDTALFFWLTILL